MTLCHILPERRGWVNRIICLDYVLRISIDKIKENDSSWQREEAEGTPQKQSPTSTTPITAILANSPTQDETLLHSLERAAAGIGLHVIAHKTEYMCFYQTGDISILHYIYIYTSSTDFSDSPSPTQLYRPWLPAGLLGYILCLHRAAVDKF